MKIRTYTGLDVDPHNMRDEDINPLDIAHALSCINRFNGHSDYPYSVARHSLLVLRLVTDMGGTPDEARAALLHDAAEAYLGDIVSPLKTEAHKAAEDRALRVILKRFGLAMELPEIVKRADEIALVIEWDDLMEGGYPGPPVEIPEEFLGIVAYPGGAHAAELEFKKALVGLGIATREEIFGDVSHEEAESLVRVDVTPATPYGGALKLADGTPIVFQPNQFVSEHREDVQNAAAMIRQVADDIERGQPATLETAGHLAFATATSEIMNDLSRMVDGDTQTIDDGDIPLLRTMFNSQRETTLANFALVRRRIRRSVLSVDVKTQVIERIEEVEAEIRSQVVPE